VAPILRQTQLAEVSSFIGGSLLGCFVPIETSSTASFSMFPQSLGGHCWELGPSWVFLHLPTQRIKERENQNLRSAFYEMGEAMKDFKNKIAGLQIKHLDSSTRVTRGSTTTRLREW
jgi:hypothetical protein